MSLRWPQLTSMRENSCERRGPGTRSERGSTPASKPPLHRGLARPRTALAAAVSVAGMALVPSVGFGLFPEADAQQFLVQVETPEGSSLQETGRAVRFVERTLARRPKLRYSPATTSRTSAGGYS